jgi:uncharacterized protein (TIGR02186 family)
MMKRGLAWMLLAGSLLPLQTRAADPLVVAPEANHVDITVNFAGTELTAFGALDRPGDLIIKVSGPPQEVTLSREVKRGPFWLEGGRAEVEGAPSLLYLYATRPIADILSVAEREKHGLELEAVTVRIEPARPGDAPERWRKAFFRLKEKEGRYLEDDHAIRVIGNRLFLAHIPLPGELQIGTYEIETLLVQHGAVVGRAVTHFEVRQVGIEQWTWNVAHDHPWLFGCIFTLAMMLLGLLLNALSFRASSRIG